MTEIDRVEIAGRDIREERSATPTRPGLKVYHAPKILFCEGLEMIAATCSGGTAKANVGACPIGPIQS